MKPLTFPKWPWLLLAIATGAPADSVLWYDQPADKLAKTRLQSWEHENLKFQNKGNPDKAWHDYVLPIGNGRMGAGVFGGVELERIQLNEKTIWSGGPGTPEYMSGNRKDAWKKLPAIRKALVSGDAKAAEALAKETLCGVAPENAPDGRTLFGSYQTLGELNITTGIRDASVAGYRRQLDLESGLVSVGFQTGGVKHRRTMFCSYPDQLVCARFEANKGGQQNLKIEMGSPHPLKGRVEGGTWILTGKHAGNGLVIETRIHPVVTGGKTSVTAEGISISSADEVTLLVTAGTDYAPVHPNYRGGAPAERLAQIIAAAAARGADEIQQRHVADHQALFGRVGLNLGASSAKQRKLPTDQRIKAYAKTPDRELEALYFQYGRYLLIGSSRPGSLPANLQGVWNNEIMPAWASDYHLNINLQMNYWPAETCNLSECHLPLMDYLDLLRIPGEETAKDYFNARGWSANLHSNIWGFTAPSPGNGPMFWKYFPLGGAWTAQHAWEHFAFTRDKQWLAKQGYPILKSVAVFLEDYLYKLPSGELASCPSWSPEHGPISQSTTADGAMAWDALNNAAAAAEALGVDADEAERWRGMRDQLVPLKVGRFGQLQEWYEDIDKEKDQHRHINHLYALHPGRQISPVATPELAKAALVTLTNRGDGATGWSMGWKINFWARMHDGDHAHKLFGELLGKRTLPNMWDTHAPFQIDGNFGGTAGIAEMLLQSQVETKDGRPLIHLLPALPAAWPDGSVTGLRARGGYELDIIWKDGRLTSATIHGDPGGKARVQWGDQTRDITLEKGDFKTVQP